MSDRREREQQRGEGRRLSARSLLTARRLLLSVAALFLIAGFGLFSVFLYRAAGTSFSDAGPGRGTVEAVLRYRNDPGAVYDRPVATPAPSPTPSPATGVTFRVDPPDTRPAPPPPPPLPRSSYRMIIDRIGVDSVVSAYGLDARGIPQVPLVAYEIAWYDFSAEPGTGGNAVFAGHVTWSGRAVFYHLNTLVPGDTVRLRASDGTELVYTVSETFLVDPNDPAALSVMGPTDYDAITIITCDGEFFYTGDPVFRGDYTNRRVVRATLAGSSPAVGQPPAAGG